MFVLFPKCFGITLLFSLIATNISGSTAWGRLSISTESRNDKKYSGRNCHALSSWLTAVKAVEVLMRACAMGRKREIGAVVSSGEGERGRGERTGSGRAEGRRGSEGPGFLGRAAGGVCGLVAREKGTGDGWSCPRVLQYSWGLAVLAASTTSFFSAKYWS